MLAGAGQNGWSGAALVKIVILFLCALVCAVFAGGCSTSPISQTGSGPVAGADTGGAKRRAPVVAGRPARVFVWAGFDEKDCSAVTPTIAVAQKPAKGAVSFRPNQTTTIKHSNSGKCLGQKLPGVGIYYTARKGENGPDHFSVTATTADGQSATRSFEVEVVE